MKISKILFFILAISLFSCCKPKEEFTIECLTPDLQNGVIAFYPFNNGSLNDFSQNNNHLTDPSTAIPGTDRAGNANCAYQFDNINNTNEFLTTTNTNFLNNIDQFSISLWYQPIDSTRDGGSYEALIARNDVRRCPDRMGEWSVGLFDCRRAVFGHDNSVWAEFTTSGSNICEREIFAVTGNWHHVVATKDADKYQIYFNGAINDTDQGAAGCSNPHIAEDIGDLFIGKGAVKFAGAQDGARFPLLGVPPTERKHLERSCQMGRALNLQNRSIRSSQPNPEAGGSGLVVVPRDFQAGRLNGSSILQNPQDLPLALGDTSRQDIHPAQGGHLAALQLQLATV